LSGVYSHTFLNCFGGSASASYVVPEGKRAVLRTVTVAISATQQGLWQAGAHTALIGTGVMQVGAPTLVLDVRVAVYGGHSMNAYTAIPGLYVCMAGYLFDDASGANGPPEAAQQLPAPTPLPWLDGEPVGP
jgi:hypothetical protein